MKKRLLVLGLAIVVAFSSVPVSAQETVSVVSEQTTNEIGGAWQYDHEPAVVTPDTTNPVDSKNAIDATGNTVTTTAKGKATLTAVKKTTKKSFTVASKTKVNGVEYTVDTIGAKAFKNATKATTVTLPKTIAKIKANAFAKSKVTTVKITVAKGKKLTVDKKAFKSSKVKKVVVTMSKKATSKEKKAIKKAFTNAGIKAKNISIKLK